MPGDYTTADVLLMALRNFAILGGLACFAGFVYAAAERWLR